MSNRIPVVSLDELHDALPAGDTLPGRSVQLSSDPGNVLAVGADDGLYVPPTTATLSVAGTNTLSLSGDGSAALPLSGAVRLSGSGNLITTDAAGLKVPAASSSSTTAGSSSTEAVTPNALRYTLQYGAKYPINIAYEGPAGTGGTTLQVGLTQPGGGGAPSAIRVNASTTGDGGSVRLLDARITSAHDVALWGLDLSVQSSVSNSVRALVAAVKGAIGCSALDLTLSTNATPSVNTLRSSTGDNGLYVKGNITATGTITPSDARLKRNIEPIDRALDRLTALRVVTFEKTHPEDVDKPDAVYTPGVGVTAQELRQVLPQAVSVMRNGYLATHDHDVLFLAVRAVQELAARVAELESQR